MKEKKENTVSNIWTAQENLIHFYKVISLGLGALVAIVFIFALIAYFKDPIVVIQNTSGQEFYPAARKSVTVKAEDVEAFVLDYLKSLYIWDRFDPKKLSDEISPFSEEGLVPKLMDGQIQKFGKNQDKKLSQDLSFVSVKILKDRVICSFMRVLKIEGIPLVVPTELTLSLVEGSRTRSNPKGIYISGIIENERAK